MAPRQLITRWRKYEAKRRRTRLHPPKKGGYNSLARIDGAEVGTRPGKLEHSLDRLNKYWSRVKPHKTYLRMFFAPVLQQVSERLEGDKDPKLVAELLEQRYRDEDPRLEVFQWHDVLLSSSDFHEVWMHFNGQRCFLVYRQDDTVFKSREYKNPMFLKKLPLKKVEWAGEPIDLRKVSLPTDDS